MEISQRTKANMEVVLEEVCRQFPSGGDHGTRRFIAERFTEAAEHGETRLGELEAAARHALMKHR
jgi:hypothetical protein